MKFAKLDKQRQSEIRSSVYLLRFRTDSPSFKSKVFRSYANISRMLAVPYNTVQHLCRYGLKTKRKPKKDKAARRLDQEQTEFLLKKGTLILWAGDAQRADGPVPPTVSAQKDSSNFAAQTLFGQRNKAEDCQVREGQAWACLRVL